MLGVDIPNARLEQARSDEQARGRRPSRKKEQHAPTTLGPEWDDDFAFIAGYTEGGAPYGIRWDEADEQDPAWRRVVGEAGGGDRLLDDADLPF